MRKSLSLLTILFLLIILSACSEVEEFANKDSDFFSVSTFESGVKKFEVIQHKPTGCQYTSSNGSTHGMLPIYTPEGFPYCVDTESGLNETTK